MGEAGLAHTRKLTIIAQDPGLRVDDGRILTTEVEVPLEDLEPGPRGYRVHVIDYDVSTGTFYRPAELNPHRDNYRRPVFEHPPTAQDFQEYNDRLLNEPGFHAQNTYAIVMRILSRFEYALGRRVKWSFDGHQLVVAPHAFADANAFYSKEQQSLLFGYFRGKEGTPIFSCLAHDVIAHETTHALLDGLRQRYTDPSSPEQAGFHEGFADIIALLSIFSLTEVVGTVLRWTVSSPPTDKNLIHSSDLTLEKLKEFALLGLAKQMGAELSGVRGRALRRSVALPPDSKLIKDPDYEEPHRRGEILVAAVLNAFLHIWVKRLSQLGQTSDGYYPCDRVIEEGASIADYLLTMCIRAIDYSPPTDLQFCDFLSAILTADHEIHPDDSKYQFRKVLLERFRAYGIEPTSKAEDGMWEPPNVHLTYAHSHFENLQRDADEVFRFVWQNRRALGLHEEAYTRVISVRPCLRVGPDGFALRETVAEYIQMIDLRAMELADLGIEKPERMSDSKRIRLYGGGALVFDEYCRLKFHVRNKIGNVERQTHRLRYLWRFGYFKEGSDAQRSFAEMHRMKFA
ncbi:MAG: hypothetical protein U0Q18_00850 [Bryobacteraceae bacterium]